MGRWFIIDLLSVFWLPRLLRFRITVHAFYGSNRKGVFHSHGSWTASLILRRGYWEGTLDGNRYWRGPGSLLIRSSRYYHNITARNGVPWTIYLVWFPVTKRTHPETASYFILADGSRVPLLENLKTEIKKGEWKIHTKRWLWCLSEWRRESL